MQHIINFAPGRYLNRRNKLVTLVAFPDTSYLVDEKTGHFYNDQGHCMYWSETQHRLILDTDTRYDLVMSGPVNQ
jgi:hypothetical protein